MATYQYEAMDSVGKTVKGNVEARTAEDAISSVRSMGYFPTKIKKILSSSTAKKSTSSRSPKSVSALLEDIERLKPLAKKEYDKSQYSVRDKRSTYNTDDDYRPVKKKYAWVSLGTWCTATAFPAISKWWKEKVIPWWNKDFGKKEEVKNEQTAETKQN